MARRKAKKTAKKLSPSPVREAENESKPEEQAPLVSNEDGMLKFILVPILFPKSELSCRMETLFCFSSNGKLSGGFKVIGPLLLPSFLYS